MPLMPNRVLTNPTNRQLIQVVPSMPPHVDGIGDHALELARQLRANHGIDTIFIVCDPAWKGDGSFDFPAYAVSVRTCKAFVELSAEISLTSGFVQVPMLVHFSPYGYQKRGCPFWLVDALEQVDRAVPGRVNTAFHELDVNSSSPFGSAFWVSPLQRGLIRRLTRLGVFNYTNTELHRTKLENWGSGRIACVTNFSTMADTDAPPSFSDRAREVIVFGRADQRRWTYQRGGEALSQVCQHIEATRIVDIGAPIHGYNDSRFKGVPIERCGVLSPADVVAAVRNAFAGFLYYPVPLLSKSSAVALMRASGTIPFVFDDSKVARSCPGLTAGVDFVAVTPGGRLSPLSSLMQLPSRIYSNYGAHSSRMAAGIIARDLVEEFSQRSLLTLVEKRASEVLLSVSTSQVLAATLSAERKVSS